jgi:hypothetical protein
MATSFTDEEQARLEKLTPEQRALVAAREPLWRRAYEIAAGNPSVDVSDVYHTLVTWHETPTQKLTRALRRGRLFARTR